MTVSRFSMRSQMVPRQTEPAQKRQHACVQCRPRTRKRTPHDDIWMVRNPNCEFVCVVCVPLVAVPRARVAVGFISCGLEPSCGTSSARNVLYRLGKKISWGGGPPSFIFIVARLLSLRMLLRLASIWDLHCHRPLRSLSPTMLCSMLSVEQLRFQFTIQHLCA